MQYSQKQKEIFLSLVLPAIVPFGTLIVQTFLWHYFQPYVWFLFYPTVFFMAWIGGMRGALISSIISAFIVLWFFIPPTYTIDKNNLPAYMSVLVFIILGYAFGLVQQKLKNANLQLSNLNDKLKNMDRHKTEFFSNISHEFRTPLTLILSPSEELFSRGENISPERVKSNVEIIHRNALRLLKLVNTLLDFSRIEAGRAKVLYEATDISKLTAELASNFSSASDLAKLKLIIDCPPLDELVEIDRDMWEKIVLNLLSNAFKYTHQGTIAVSIRLENNKAVLRVQDTGIGIPQEAIPKLFERFYRVENAHGRSYEGTGIGLSLIKELINLQGGTIEVSSQEGNGSTFSVFLPLGIKHSPSEDKTHERKEDDQLPQHTQMYMAEMQQWNSDNKPIDKNVQHNSKGVILVADDNSDMREFIKRLLEEAGYDVIIAADGMAAWEICQKNQPDLVLSDVMMPRMNGFELLKNIRSMELTYNLPIILLSARSAEKDQVIGLNAGADDYLTKPFHSSELIARVDGAVKLGKYRKTAHEQLLAQTSHIAKIGGWSFDVATMRGEWTEELIRIHDLPLDEPIDVSKGLEFYAPQSRPIIEKAVKELSTFGKSYDLELEIISAKGVHKWVRTVGEPVIENGKVIKAHGVMQDITVQKNSEDAIKIEQENVQNYLDIVGVMILVLDNEKNVKLINKRGCEILGYSSEEVIGKNWMDNFIPQHVRMQVEEVSESILNKEKKKISYFENPILTKNGEERLIAWRNTPLFDVMGNIIGGLSSGDDITERKRNEEKIINYLKKLKSIMNGTLLAVSKMVEQRDPYTAGHEERVGIIAGDIAREMGYSEEKCAELKEIGLVHDIGKISIPAEILSKPGKLTEIEYALIKTHPEKGYEILKNIEFPFPIAEIIYQHHERLDGSGYPRGLKGDEILLEARILAVADVIEAMASHRPYRAGLGVDQALAEIERGRGISYDTDVVDACLHLFKEKNYLIPMQE